MWHAQNKNVKPSKIPFRVNPSFGPECLDLPAHINNIKENIISKLASKRAARLGACRFSISFLFKATVGKERMVQRAL